MLLLTRRTRGAPNYEEMDEEAQHVAYSCLARDLNVKMTKQAIRIVICQLRRLPMVRLQLQKPLRQAS